ncbi:SubName: Full=Uncharacterized protein {ECO:0000313/EMBL:CCA66871.1} [Serendipita indica DSM 11827]|nr:SubName: Full=Uncharacterized protein {ECO:0000313/EMBL:CCA66871.1} [Serendipita indica DSM 11827]
MARAVIAALKDLQKEIRSLKLGKDVTVVATELEQATDKLKSANNQLDDAQARELFILFDSRLEPLYKTACRATVQFSASYFSAITAFFATHKTSRLWQRVACGLLPAITSYALQPDDETQQCVGLPMTFVSKLCYTLNCDSSPQMSITLRDDAITCLDQSLRVQPEVKEWLLDPKILGINALAKLFASITEFRVMDSFLQLVTRIAPSRKDVPARTKFFRSIMSMVADIMGAHKLWKERFDPIHARISQHPKRPKRFVIGDAVLTGNAYPKDNVLRLFIDSEINLVIDTASDGHEVKTIKFQDVIKSQVMMETAEEHQIVRLEIQKVLFATKDAKNAENICFRLPLAEAEKLSKVLASRAIRTVTIASEAARPPKQSLSQHPTTLEAANDQLAPSITNKTEAIEKYYNSASKSPQGGVKAMDSSDSPEGIAVASKRLELECRHPTYESDNDDGTSDLTSLDEDPPKETRNRPLFKPATRGRALIPNSQNDDEIILKPLSLKRARAALGLRDDEASRNSKRPRTGIIEKTAVIINTDDQSSPLPTRRISSSPTWATELCPVEEPANTGALNVQAIDNEDDPSAQMRLHGHQTVPKQAQQTRIKGMKAMDGGTASPRPIPKVEQALKEAVAKRHSEPPLASVREALSDVKTIAKNTNGNQRTKKRLEKALWEAEDFSQKLAALKEDLPKSSPLPTDVNNVSRDEASPIPVNEYLQGGQEIIIDEPGSVHDQIKPQSGPSPKLQTGLHLGESDPPTSPIHPKMSLKQKERDAVIQSRRQEVKELRLDASDKYPTEADSEKVLPHANVSTGVENSMSAALRFKRVQPEQASSRLPITKVKPNVTFADGFTAFSKPNTLIVQHTKEKAKNPMRKPVTLWVRPPVRKLAIPDAEDSDNEEAEDEKETEMDKVAKALTAINEVIIDNIERKVIGIRQEARIARRQIMTEAAEDLRSMRKVLEHSSHTLRSLDEAYGQVGHDVILSFEDLDRVNERIKGTISGIISGHKRMVEATGRKTLFTDALPGCLTTI